MSRKQWYVSAIGLNGGKNLIQYASTKKEAEAIKKEIDKQNEFNYTVIDFVWKSDIEKKVPSSRLHGKLYTKVENI